MVTIGRNSMLLALCNSIHNTQHCEWKCYFPSDTQIHFPELPPSAHIPFDFPFIVFALCLYAHYSDDLCVCTRYGLVFRMLYFYTFVHSFRSLILSCSVSSEFSSLCSMHVLRHSGCACASPPSMCVRVCAALCLREIQLISGYIFMKISGPSSVSQTNLWMKHTKSSPTHDVQLHCLCVFRLKFIVVIVRTNRTNRVSTTSQRT